MTARSIFKRRIRLGYILSFLLLLFSYCLLFYVQQRQVKEAARVTHSYTVINKSEALKSELTNAETGMRGFVIIQDSLFLQPYNEAIINMPLLLNELSHLVADNEDQSKKLDTLQQLINRKMDNLTKGLTNFRSNGFVITAEWKLQRQEGQKSMDSIRLYAARVTDAEQKLMEKREAKLSGLFHGAEIAAIISLLIIFAALIYSLITLNMENKAKEKAVKRAEQYKVDLESNKNELKEKDIELKELKDMEKFTTTGRIARTIAHEVRNPLTNILLATEQLKDSPNKSEETDLLLELINRNASRINQLVSDLLNATRFTQLDFSNVEVNQLLEETIEMAKDRIDLNRISVEKNYLREKCEVSVDKEKMKVALLNVMVNAIEAMAGATKPVLELRTKKDGDLCIIEIIDNGKGIGKEELQKLFDPYFTTKPKGNGLGLTNTQSIILNHNGKINVYSEPGRGTVFSIELDRVKQGNT